MELNLEKSSDDHGYCLIYSEKGTKAIRKLISRIWAVPNEECPGWQKIMYWNHGAIGITTLRKRLLESETDKFMRTYLISN